jgi:methionyl-tRNA formyltransferase
MSKLGVVFFGMEGLFSRAPLAALLAEERVRVNAIIVPRPMNKPAESDARFIAPPARLVTEIPIIQNAIEPNIIRMAWDAGIPVLEVATLSHPHTRAMIANLQPDVICVACFPKLLPRAIFQIAKRAALNLHPAMLPAYRGPSPLFWIFHDGLEHAGITLHLLDTRADRGEIVSQTRVALPDGIAYSDAERICAERGARLLIDAIRADTFARTPQSDGVFPTAPAPRDDDFILTRDWSARRAFNFIRGIAEWNRAITFKLASEQWVVRDAIAFDESEILDAPIKQIGAHWKIQCSPGTLTIPPA